MVVGFCLKIFTVKLSKLVVEDEGTMEIYFKIEGLSGN